jgi:hypothetical protein
MEKLFQLFVLLYSVSIIEKQNIITNLLTDSITRIITTILIGTDFTTNLSNLRIRLFQSSEGLLKGYSRCTNSIN